MAPETLDVGKGFIESSKRGLVMSAAVLSMSLPAVVFMVRYLGSKEVQLAEQLLVEHNRIFLPSTRNVLSLAAESRARLRKILGTAGKHLQSANEEMEIINKETHRVYHSSPIELEIHKGNTCRITIKYQPLIGASGK